MPSPQCDCGTGIEDLFHFLYNCPFYDVIRERLMFDLTALGLINISIPVLFDCDLHIDNSATIHRLQEALFRYIISTRRF